VFPLRPIGQEMMGNEGTPRTIGPLVDKARDSGFTSKTPNSSLFSSLTMG
jgi:hypothetical protein